MRRILRVLTPKRAVGISALGSVAVCCIVLLNLAFVHVYFGYFPQSISFFALQAIVVGTPFVTFFCWVLICQAKLQYKLSLLSRKDGLTGLNNRRTFLDLADKRMKEAAPGVLLLLDADHFKRVNDDWGHAVGDICLRKIAHRLEWNLRPTDVAGRVGGEEFAIYLPDTTQAQALAIAERLGKPITYEANESGSLRTVTLSIGAVKQMGDETLSVLYSRADSALYDAKDAGRACTRFWTPTADQAQQLA